MTKNGHFEPVPKLTITQKGGKSMKLLKKNQIVIYVIALMLMAVAYLNYTTNTAEQSVQASMQMEARDDSNTANIGDATLVSSNDVLSNTDTVNESSGNDTTASNTESSNTINNENTTNTTSDNSNDNRETTQTNAQTSTDDDYFTKSKLERDTMYSQMLESYENILNSTNSLETQKQSATDEIKKINDTKNSIMICENLIQTKGFENSIIFVNGDSISVILKSDELTQEEVAQVQNIISREMNCEIENIHISTK